MIERSCAGVLIHFILSCVIGLPGLILMFVHPLLGIAYAAFLFFVIGVFVMMPRRSDV